MEAQLQLIQVVLSPEIDSMIIGDSSYGVDSSMIIKRIMYYSDRLPNSQLVTLTS